MLRENGIIFSISANKYFLPLQSNIFLKLKAVSHFTSRNWEAIDHPVLAPEYYTPEYYRRIIHYDTKNVDNLIMCF